MSNSILFVIPTLFNDPKLVNQCVIALVENLKNFNVSYKIVVVSNEPSQAFDEYIFSVPVSKMSSNVQFNVSKALNLAYTNNQDFEYFCFFDEGLKISNTSWLEYLIMMFEENPNVGQVGCREHSTFLVYNKPVVDDPPIYEVLWADGIVLCKMQSLNEVNGFDESFFADRELQDFGYRLTKLGYTNYLWKDLAESHSARPFELKHKNASELLKLKARSQDIFIKRWGEFEKNKSNNIGKI